MAIELSTFKDILTDYPGQFDQENPRRIQRYLDRAASYLDEGEWSEKDYPLAVTYWALHQLASNPSPPIDGNISPNPIVSLGLDPATIKSIVVDDEFTITLQNTIDLGIGSEGSLTSTKWGRLFLELESRRQQRVAFGRTCEADRLTQSARSFTSFPEYF